MIGSLLRTAVPPDAAGARLALVHGCARARNEACAELARLDWSEGRGDEAGAGFAQACAAGDSRACEDHVRCMVAERCPLDRELAVRELGPACTAKRAGACQLLGWIYSRGWHGERDLERAASGYDLACDLGLAEGCFGLAKVAEERGDAQARAAAMQRGCAKKWIRGCVADGGR
jgi:TPR repeat protein